MLQRHIWVMIAQPPRNVLKRAIGKRDVGFAHFRSWSCSQSVDLYFLCVVVVFVLESHCTCNSEAGLNLSCPANFHNGLLLTGGLMIN